RARRVRSGGRMIDLGLIPAAGKGVRAYPKSSYVPKPMLEIAGVPLVQRNLEILRDAMGIREIVIIVGYLGDHIRRHLGDGSRHGVAITYVQCDEPDIGLARGIALAEPHLPRPFATILADELYLGTNHAELRAPDGDWFAVCAVKHVDDPRLIERNYSVAIAGGRIVDVEEKPQAPTSGLLGCGSYLFTPELFERIRTTPPSPRSGRVELTDVIGAVAREGPRVFPFVLEGHYINVNRVEDYHAGNYLARTLAFDRTKISIVIPAYNEEDSIGHVVADFAAHPLVHEVFVVDNSSKDATARVAAERGARVETVSLHGYGDTIKYGLDHAAGDLLVIVEADHSFRSRDLGKLVEYAKDADMAIGTRTTRQMIEQGTNMQGALRWGNVVVGKLVEALWWSQEPRFTDVGCTYRALWRSAWNDIRDEVRGVGPEFSPELMVEMLRARKRVIEVPVSYFPRLGGDSKHSKNYLHIARTALRMLRIVFEKRLGLG
ncbi:MAG: glycosyltransferase, partial [Myxococcales bacterium]|nr:glycosyltransferase [Myxococcales bacterium]